MAATCTGRGSRRKCSGCLDIENLPRIENAARIERGLQGTHGGNLRLGARDAQVGFPLEPYAVLGGDRARNRPQRLVNTTLDGMESRLRYVAGTDGDVQVAVGNVPEHEDPRA